jgi:transcriptional regulator with PAS, ATPase and Fis domain
LFEIADGGTLFLDEINNTSAALQAKLLRVIQEGEVRPVGGVKTKKVDVRVLSASNKDLKLAVQEGQFREDLFFRINVLTVRLPPLRERTDDIPLLAARFIRGFNKSLHKQAERFSGNAMAVLCRYQWPGNVRQLENVVERCLTLIDAGEKVIRTELLPDEFVHEDSQITGGISLSGHLSAAVEELERQMVSRALKNSNGNRTKAAENLGLSRRGLINKIERYELE